MNSIIDKLSYFLFNWVLDPRTNDYKPIWQNIRGGGYGMFYNFWILISVCLLFVISFYFVVSKNAEHSTKKDYLITFVLGLITLIGGIIIVLALKTDSSLLYGWNLYKILVINIVYYIVLYQLFSSIFKKMSKNAKNMDLIECLKK